MAEVQGFCEKRFGAVREALAASLDDEDIGASAAVFLHGEPVVDIWGRVRRRETHGPRGLPAGREEQYQGVDHILGATMRYGMGYGIFNRSCGWGGSMVMVDLDAGMSVAYVMNQMLDGDVRGLGIVMAAYEGLG